MLILDENNFFEKSSVEFVFPLIDIWNDFDEWFRDVLFGLFFRFYLFLFLKVNGAKIKNSMRN